MHGKGIRGEMNGVHLLLNTKSKVLGGPKQLSQHFVLANNFNLCPALHRNTLVTSQVALEANRYKETILEGTIYFLYIVRCLATKRLNCSTKWIWVEVR